MKPIGFKEANGTLLGGGPEQFGTDVSDLPVFRNGERIISCWRPTWKELLAVLWRRRVWLSFVASHTHPPVAVIGSKTAFIEH